MVTYELPLQADGCVSGGLAPLISVIRTPESAMVYRRDFKKLILFRR